MPLPTKIWAENAGYSVQPSDTFLDDGLHPKLPWFTEHVNWTLNFIWGVLVGTEHDRFTGAHTDVTYDTITSNDGAQAKTILPATFRFHSPASTGVIMHLGSAYWSGDDVGGGRVDFFPGVPSVLYLGGATGLDTNVYYDVTAQIPGAGFSAGLTLTNIVLHLWHNTGTGAGDVTWTLLKMDSSAGSSGTVVATAALTVNSLALAGVSTPPTVAALSFGGPLTLNAGERLVLRLNYPETTGAELLWGGGAVVYTRTNNFGG